MNMYIWGNSREARDLHGDIARSDLRKNLVGKQSADIAVFTDFYDYEHYHGEFPGKYSVIVPADPKEVCPEELPLNCEWISADDALKRLTELCSMSTEQFRGQVLAHAA